MGRFLWAIWYAVAKVFFIVTVSVVVIAMTMTMVIVWLATHLWDRESNSLLPISHLYARLIFWTNPLQRVRVKGRENLAPDKVYVIAANHRSMFDIPVMYFLPWSRKFKWVARKGISKWAIFGQILRLHNDIVIDKESEGATREVIMRSVKRLLGRGKKVLSEGWSVAIFPEGTRSRTDDLEPFQGGAFKLAKEAGVDILPVAICYRKGKYKGVKRITLSILPSISGADPREAQERTKELIKEELVVLRNDGTKE